MTMRLLCDEHVGEPLVRRLRSSFHVEHVLDVDSLGQGSPDTDLWEYAATEELVVFTNDTDFVDGTVASDGDARPGVIRYVGTDWSAIYHATCEIDRYLTMDQLRGNTLHVPGNWL